MTKDQLNEAILNLSADFAASAYSGGVYLPSAEDADLFTLLAYNMILSANKLASDHSKGVPKLKVVDSEPKH